MKFNSLLIILTLAFSSFAHGFSNFRPIFRPPTKQVKFWSPTSTESTLEFEFKVEILSTTEPSENVTIDQVQKQVAFLFGTFDNQEQRAVPKSNHKIKIQEVVSVETNKWLIRYKYTGTIQSETYSENYSFDLPLNPDLVYRKSLVSLNSRTSFPCGDEQHPEQKYFWYFFNPRAQGCPLIEGVDYENLVGRLTVLANTTETYPEYARLVHEGVVQIHIFYGMDDPTKTHIPHKSYDYNASNYNQTKNFLLAKKFQQKTIKDGTGNKPYIEEFSKKTTSGLILVRMFFGGTDSFFGSDFHRDWATALKNGAVVIYAGHSGLGSYLNIDEIESISNVKITMPQERYQMMFMNGCSSYPYYADPYFALKKNSVDPTGTKNLDIITNGLATYFSAIYSSNKAVISAIENWAMTGTKTSYQSILKEADSNNMIGVNGDEDNPTTGTN